jgi:DNA anti-recombination protein RmuC
MTILITLWRVLTGNKIARTIGMVVMAVLGALTFGKINQWTGASGQRAKDANTALKKTVEGAANAREGRAEAVEKLRQGNTPEEIVRSNDDAWS